MTKQQLVFERAQTEPSLVMWLSGFLAAEAARIRKGTDFSNGLQGENMALSQPPYNHLVSTAGATQTVESNKSPRREGRS
jgi:hypothetical protein